MNKVSKEESNEKTVKPNKAVPFLKALYLLPAFLLAGLFYHNYACPAGESFKHGSAPFNAKIVSAGAGHTLAIKQDGTLWAWGCNSHGQLGNGTFAERNSPTQIGGYKNWSSIAAGAEHTVALRSDGTLWAWGYNEKSQLGDGTKNDKNAPVQIN